MDEVKLAFYKGNKGWISRLIAWWKNSQYTHVEVKVGDFFYSSSEVDGGVRAKRMRLNPDKWTIVSIPYYVHPMKTELFFNRECGKKYDWAGIIKSQIFGSNRHNPNKWFCSEICAKAIGLSEPNRHCPQSLYNFVKDVKRLTSSKGE